MAFAMRELKIDEENVHKGIITEADIEKGLTLLGVSGIEDLLQDEVPEVVRDLEEAAIKVWMITGDKGDTARSIAHNCGFFSKEDTEIFKIEGTKEEVSKQVIAIAN